MQPRDFSFWTATLLLLAAFAPRAHAQICLPLMPCPDTTPPSVSISAPAHGATVSGIVVVKASASDNRGVAGVQFSLDGAALGAEDTAAPYEVSWDTAGVPNGSHTLRAAARDAAGNTANAAPVTVTVANGVPQAVRRFEESDARVSYSLGWGASQGGWFAWSGGAAAETTVPGARATFNFEGTSATWIGYRSGRSGIARVFLDGVQLADVDLFARTDEPRA
ncbi:MAG TPA: Ig-like domain-containing protein, partial [Burkholderiales bacterium]|nr:Ig-like domain-containing protein [Burkholderiales bacterium]